MKKEELQCNTVDERFVCTVPRGMLHPYTHCHFVYFFVNVTSLMRHIPKLDFLSPHSSRCGIVTDEIEFV